MDVLKSIKYDPFYAESNSENNVFHVSVFLF
jgi:hypothetical protein